MMNIVEEKTQREKKSMQQKQIHKRINCTKKMHGKTVQQEGTYKKIDYTVGIKIQRDKFYDGKKYIEEQNI